MSAYPNTALPARPIITWLSYMNRGITNFGAASSATWPTTNKAFFVPITLDTTIIVQTLFVVNGATASNNFDLGIYSADGTKLVSTGSTAQAGTNTLQVVTLGTPLTIGPSLYYLATAFNGTTGTTFKVSLGVNGVFEAGVYIQTSAFPLPANATFATASAETIIPITGLSTVTNV